MNEEQLSQYLEFAKNIAHKAADIMRKYYRIDQQVTLKLDRTPVTIADTEVNSMLIEEVQQRFPEHGVLGEEESWQAAKDELWVCDPIDGTVAYSLHMPLSMFSLAFVVKGRPVVAVAYNPWTGDMYSAVKDQGAFRNETPIQVSTRPWNQALLAGSSGGARSKEVVDQVSSFNQLKAEGVVVVNVSGTVFKGCLIAEGSLDGRTFLHSGAHDVAALKLIIEEAGGKVTDLQGNEQPYSQPLNGAIMSNGVIHQQLQDLVAQHENSRD